LSTQKRKRAPGAGRRPAAHEAAVPGLMNLVVLGLMVAETAKLLLQAPGFEPSVGELRERALAELDRLIDGTTTAIPRPVTAEENGPVSFNRAVRQT